MVHTMKNGGFASIEAELRFCEINEINLVSGV
jgi:hypothetical protein